MNSVHKHDKDLNHKTRNLLLMLHVQFIIFYYMFSSVLELILQSTIAKKSFLVCIIVSFSSKMSKHP